MRRILNCLMVSVLILCVEALLPKAVMAFSTGATQVKPRPVLTCTGPWSRYTLFDAAPTLDPTLSRSVTVPYFRLYADCPAPFSTNVLLRERGSHLSDYLRSVEIVEDETGAVIGIAEPMTWQSDAREHWTNLQFHGDAWIHVNGSTNFSLRLNFDTNAPASALDGVIDFLLPESQIVRTDITVAFETTVGGSRFINTTDLLVETPSLLSTAATEEMPRLHLGPDTFVPPTL